MARPYVSVSRSGRRDATRRKLRRQALRLFSLRGFGTTQIADIARASGVATGTFYLHYDDKEALARDALEDFNKGFLDKLARGLASAAEGADAADPSRLIGRATDAFLEHWWEERVVVRGLAQHFSHSGQVEPLLEGFSPGLVTYLTDLFEPWTGGGREEAELYAHGLLGLWLRVGLRFAFEAKDRREFYGAALARMTRGLLKEIRDADGLV